MREWDQIPITTFMPRTESLAMPEAVPVSGRVRNFKVCGHVNMVSQGNLCSRLRLAAKQTDWDLLKMEIQELPNLTRLGADWFWTYCDLCSWERVLRCRYQGLLLPLLSDCVWRKVQDLGRAVLYKEVAPPPPPPPARSAVGPSGSWPSLLPIADVQDAWMESMNSNSWCSSDGRLQRLHGR